VEYLGADRECGSDVREKKKPGNWETGVGSGNGLGSRD